MKRYLGLAFAAVLAPCFAILQIGFGVLALRSEVSAATVFISVLCLCCSILCADFVWKNRNQLYAWGFFSDQAVIVSVLFQKDCTISYDQCRGCGIGLYRHAFLNNQQSPLGTNRYFIFLSTEPFDEKYRYSINLWAPTDTRMKVLFREKTYQYLMSVLPPRQAGMLKRDYSRYIEKK